MSKRNKKAFKLLLSTMMVFSVVPSTVYAAPDQETEATIEQDANEEVKQEDTVNNEADASADQTDTKQDETKADDTAQKNDEAAQKTDNAATQAGNAAQPVVDGADVTVAGTSITIPAIKFQGANAAVEKRLQKMLRLTRMIRQSRAFVKNLKTWRLWVARKESKMMTKQSLHAQKKKRRMVCQRNRFKQFQDCTRITRNTGQNMLIYLEYRHHSSWTLMTAKMINWEFSGKCWHLPDNLQMMSEMERSAMMI